MNIRGRAFLITLVCILSIGCGREPDKTTQALPSNESVIGLVGPLTYRTPEETIIAYQTAIDERDSVTYIRLNTLSRNNGNFLMWPALKKMNDGIYSKIFNIEVDYNADSTQCLVYYDEEKRDRKTDTVIKVDKDNQDHMVKISGIWKLGSGPDDPFLPPEHQNKWPELQQELDRYAKEHPENNARK